MSHTGLAKALELTNETGQSKVKSRVCLPLRDEARTTIHVDYSSNHIYKLGKVKVTSE